MPLQSFRTNQQQQPPQQQQTQQQQTQQQQTQPSPKNNHGQNSSFRQRRCWKTLTQNHRRKHSVRPPAW